jgi:hypothetical protein
MRKSLAAADPNDAFRLVIQFLDDVTRTGPEAARLAMRVEPDLLEQPGIAVRVASPRYLFAMKALAARIGRDADDLQQLYRSPGSPPSTRRWPASRSTTRRTCSRRRQNSWCVNCSPDVRDSGGEAAHSLVTARSDVR